MTTFEIIEKIASNHLTKWSIWKEKRLYINDCPQTMIYNTRKCKQSVYIDLATMTLHVYTDCPAQGNNWIANENNRVRKGLASVMRLIRIATRADRMSTTPVDVVMHNAVLEAEEVKGYYTEWREVRIAINRFGKLATRNRQFVVPFVGNKSNAPRSFVQLSDSAFSLVKETMLDPYTSPINYEDMASKINN